MRLTDLLSLSHVPRWSIVRHSPPQSVADHSFRVAVIYYELCERLKCPVSVGALWWALTHDGAECHSGDISAKFKSLLNRKALSVAEESASPWYIDCYRNLPGIEVSLVKLADELEAATFIAMHGVGPHATNVADWCRVIVQNNAYARAGNTARAIEIVTQIYREIVGEEGRFDPTGFISSDRPSTG